jgi:hypothetical protein
MTRQLYRFYLYTVYIALLIFATAGIGQLLGIFFKFTPLRDPSSPGPSQAEIVQALIFAVVSWVVAGGLGGLHYWLIRRDIRHDPAASGSGIRSFFLNMTEGIGLLFGVTLAGYSVIQNLGHHDVYGVADAAATTVAAFILVAWLEFERRRTPVERGAALAFQSLHFYGVQAVLLIILASLWFSAIRPLIDALFFGNAACRDYGSYCSTDHLGNMAGTLLWFLAFWLGYGFLTCLDRGRVARFLWHGLGLASGVGLLLFGIYNVLQVLLLSLFGEAPALKDVLGPYYAPYDFLSPLTLGLVLIGTYHFWLRRATRQGIIETLSLRFGEAAIVAVLSAVAFWIGWAMLLYRLFQMLAVATPERKVWVMAVALVITGLGYIPLHVYLQRRNATQPIATAGPYRGFVLALLGAGTLALAIGGGTALYAWLTALLGSPLPNWGEIARSGLAAAIVGGLLVALYLHGALSEHLLVRPKSAPPSIPPVTTAQPPVGNTTDGQLLNGQSVEGILDELLDNRINRTEATRQLHQLMERQGH